MALLLLISRAADACISHLNVTHQDFFTSHAKVEDYFEAPPWRPDAKELRAEISKRLQQSRSGFIVLPKYFAPEQLQSMADAFEKTFHGKGICSGEKWVKNGFKDGTFRGRHVGQGTFWMIDAMTRAFDAFTYDPVLRVAGETGVQSSRQWNHSSPEDVSTSVLTIGHHSDLTVCKDLAKSASAAVVSIP